MPGRTLHPLDLTDLVATEAGACEKQLLKFSPCA